MKRLLFIMLFIVAISGANIIQTGDAATIEPVENESETILVEDNLEKVEVEEEIVIAKPEEEPEEESEEELEEEPEEEPEEVINYMTYAIPENRGFKSYMDYRAITNKSSQQFQLQKLYANTGNYGIRVVEDRYCIAVGTHFSASIGQYLDLILENGTVIPCVLADVKADIHTDSNNIITLHNGCVSEFVVDTSSLHNTAKRMGDVSYCCEEWNSPVVEIVVYEQNVFDQ